jgi:hypothetical protein
MIAVLLDVISWLSQSGDLRVIILTSAVSYTLGSPGLSVSGLT